MISIDITENVYCPVCKQAGRNKLLFQKKGNTTGIVVIRCRGCKRDININLNRTEPLSRE